MKLGNLLLLPLLSLFPAFRPQPSDALGTGFIENRGQVDSQVRYYARGGEVSTYFTPTAVVLDLRQEVRVGESGIGHRFGPHALLREPRPDHQEPQSERSLGCAVYVRFVGANPSARIEGRGELRTHYNYFRGNDPARWQAGVPAYEEVMYHDLWPGVDLVYRNEGGGLACKALLAPLAERQAPRFRHEGADRVTPLEDGSLRVETPAGTFTHVQFSAGRTQGGFVWGERRGEPGEGTTSPSVDTPAVLLWSTFLGGGNYEDGMSLALEPSGDVVVIGGTTSLNFPSTPGAYDPSFNGDADAFVAKLDASGESLLWSTFLGGSDHDYGVSLAEDSSGSLVLIGDTFSPDFPTTPGAYDRSQNGGEDAFIAKLHSSGGSLLWSTFLGGSGNEEGASSALDLSANLVVVGYTASSNFPTTPRAYDRSHNGDKDGFVAKLNASGTSVLWSTFLGGSGFDGAWAIALDASGNPVVTGETSSLGFPTTPGAYDTLQNGESDVFIAKLDALGSSLLWSTFLGGSRFDAPSSLVLDASGNPVVTGFTDSPDFPTTPGAYDTLQNGDYDAFVAKLDTLGSSLLWGTFLGGNVFDASWCLALDASANPVLTGETGSWGFPTTPGAYDSLLDGDYDAFLTKLDAQGSSLLWSTLLGGSVEDNGYALVLDPFGRLVVTGRTESSDFPTTPGAYDRSQNGFYDVFVAKLDGTGMATGVESPPRASTGSAFQIIPNPIDGGTVLRFIADRPGHVMLRIFDSSGRLIRALLDTQVSAGTHELIWEGRDDSGSLVKSGVYFYQVETGGETHTGKLVVTK